MLITGGQLITGEAVDLRIEHGVIDEVGAAGSVTAGANGELIDASGLTLLPGAVDSHVHFSEPGSRSHWEGWATGSAAAAAGGITTVVEMPLNASPPTVNVPSFEAKVVSAQASSLVDFGLWGGVIPDNREQLQPLAAAGVLGFKAFMSRSGSADFPAADDLTLYEAMATIAPLGLPLLLHAESDTITAGLAERALAQGRTSVRDYLDSRPPAAETEAIARAIELAAVTGCRLHIVHVSTVRGVELVAAARAGGQDVTCEITSHHLTLSDADAIALGAVAKCAPPLRATRELDGLWRLLADDETLFVVSDHSPSPAELKQGDDAFAIWGGIAGLQSSIEVLLTEAGTAATGHESGAVTIGHATGGADGHAPAGADSHASAGAQPSAPMPTPPTAQSPTPQPARLPARRIPAVIASAAATRFGLATKGSLTPGKDGDVTLMELGPERILSRDELYDRHKFSAYIGRPLRARTVMTLLRGEPIYRNGRPCGPPRGRLLRPTA